MTTSIYPFRKRFFILTSLLLMLLLMPGSWNIEPALAQEPETTTFVNVNIIPMDTERVLENQTVIVEGDRITAIGPVDEVIVPAGTQVVEGEGAYLMPGLADMHMHFGAFPFEAEERPLKLLIANGVTTVRDLSSQPLFFQWEKEIAAGSRVGPQIYKGRLISPSPDKLPRIIWRAGVTAVIGLILFLVVWLIFRKRIAQTGKRLVINVSLLTVLLVVGYILTRTVVPSYQSYAHCVSQIKYFRIASDPSLSSPL